MAIDYKAAGVDVEAGYEAVERMQKHVARTTNDAVLKGMANFGGLFRMPDIAGEAVLVAGTDGVGTKLKLAFALDKHDTVGIDCVAMCVNDVLCHGAKPLFFLDYIATGHLRPDQAEAIVAGVAEGCVQAGCALIGGETAEMPGFYAAQEYDLAGFCVGAVGREALIDGRAVREGDALIGLTSSGAHSNGFSLLRKIFLGQGVDLVSPREALAGRSLGGALLEPTRIYVKPVLALIEKVAVHGIAHITGGGFFENIPRILPEGMRAEIALGSWDVPPILRLAQEMGGVQENDMFGTFNMGIGLVIALPEDQAEAAIALLREEGEKAMRIGRVAAGERGVELCPCP